MEENPLASDRAYGPLLLPLLCVKVVVDRNSLQQGRLPRKMQQVQG